MTPSLLLLLALSLAVPHFSHADCPPSAPIELQAQFVAGNQLQLDWSAPWPQSGWRIESATEAEFFSPLWQGESSAKHWTMPIHTEHQLFFRVTAIDSFATEDSSLVEDFEVMPTLYSFEGEDLEPGNWSLDGTDPAEGAFSLRLFGNTVKVLPLAQPLLTEQSQFRLLARSNEVSDRQAIGFADSSNVLWYVLWGQRGGYPDTPGQSGQVEVSSYQGYFPTGEWTSFILPAGRDFMGKFGYAPRLCSMIFANESDENPGEFLVDQVEEISGLAAQRPDAAITLQIGAQSGDSVSVTFTNPGADPFLQHHWNLGDGREVDGLSSATRNFWIHRDHSISLYVEDDTQNWQVARAELPAQASPQPRSLSMGFVGDVMTGRRYAEAGGIIETQGIDAVYDNVRSRFQAVDLMMINAECAFTTADTQHPTKGITFKTDPANVSGMVNAGVDFATLANNHTFDWMIPGLLETMDTFAGSGILSNGAGLSSEFARRPVFLSHDGMNVGVVSMSDRTGNYNNYQPFLDAGPSRPGFALWSRADMRLAIVPLRPLVDWLVVQVHSGNEYSYAPSRSGSDLDDLGVDPELGGLFARDLNPDQSERNIRREAIDLGADLVITHHPHILQGVEAYQQRLIAHSMGNFIMDLNYLETMWTALLETRVEEDQLLQATLHPAFLQNYVPQFLSGESAVYLLDHMSDLSRDFDTWVIRDAGDTTATVVLDTTAWLRNSTTQNLVVTLEDQGANWQSPPIMPDRNGYFSQLAVAPGEGTIFVRTGSEMIWWGGMEETGMEVWDVNSDAEWLDSGVSHSGQRSLHLEETNNTVSTYWTHRGPFESGFEYSLSGWVRSQNVQNLNMQMRYYDSRSGGVSQTELSTELSGTQDWTQLWQDLNPDPDRRFYQIRLRVTAGATTGTGWFDDIRLIRWNEWTELNEGDLLTLPFPNNIRHLQFRRDTPGTISVNLGRDTASPVARSANLEWSQNGSRP